MGTPVLVTTPASAVRHNPLLIIDKQGSIGISLAGAVKLSFLPLLVSRTAPQDSLGIIHIPYNKKFPRLPNNAFSQIIVIYHGEKEITSRLLSFLKKAKQLQARFILITSMTLASRELVEKIKAYPKAQVIVYGDIFGGSLSSPVTELLSQAVREKRVMLTNMGLTTRYPVALLDLTNLIVEVMVGEPTAASFFASSGARTELSLVRLLQQIDPLIRMDFQQKRQPLPAVYIPPEAHHLHPSHSDLLERLQEFMATTPVAPQPAEVVSSPVKRRSFLGGVLMTLVWLLLLPFLTSLLCAVVGFASIGIAGFSLQQGKLGLSRSFAQVGLASFTMAEPSERLISNTVTFVGLNIPDNQVTSTLTAGKTAAELLVTLTTIGDEVSLSLNGKQSVAADDAGASLKKAVISAQTLQALHVLPQPVQQRLQEDSQTISLVTNLLEVFPQLLGYTSDNPTAVLLQNNMELRPGGGFIGSFATGDIQNGKVANLTIHDVYDADGQLKGHLDPPFPLRRYLGTAHWFLRDSNFSLDSAVNATTAAQFIALETGQQVKTVVSVDLSFFQELLTLTGPIALSDYHTTVTKDNMFSEIESHVEDNFFPGSTQKKDFLTDLATTMMNTLASNPPTPLVLGRVLTTAIAEKHLLVTSRDPSVQPLLVRNGLVSSPAILTSPDILGIVESNVGANKANYFLKRTIAQRVQLAEDKSASESVTLAYTNTSHGEKFGGDYTAYLQLLVPASSQLVSVTINGTPQTIVPAVTDPAVYTKSTFEAPKGLEVATDTLDGKMVFGMPLKVKEGEERTVVITYTVSGALSSDGSAAHYTLSYFKQPGIQQDPYTLQVSYPASFTPTQYPKTAIKEQGILGLSTVVQEDQTFAFNFASNK